MSFRSKRARLAHVSKVKDIKSVQDIVSQVVRDVGTEEEQTPETLLSSSGNVTTDKHTTTEPIELQETITEVVDDISNQRNITSRPLSSHPTCQGRASRKRSLQNQSFHDITAGEAHWSDDPQKTEPTKATSMEANDVVANQNDTGSQPLTPPPRQPPPDDSPCQFNGSQRQPLWVQEDQAESDEPAEQRFSQARSSKHGNWTDDIKFDEMEEVEMIGLDGRRGKKGGKILPCHVWSLKPGVRFVVPFNALDQPVRKGGFVLVKFLGDVAKHGELCPIGEVNWHKVDKSFKADIIALVQEKFVIPNRGAIVNGVLKHVGKKWRGYRYELKMQYKKPGKTQEQVANSVPKGVEPTQWIKLVQYWFSDKSEFLSTKGKEARASRSHLHTTGSKSFAQKRDEFEKANGREPGALEWFVQTHQRKDGTFVDKTSKELLDAAAAMIAQRASTSSSSQRVAIENQVFNELMYSDDESQQRPIGYGFGVERNKIFGVAGELRKKGYLPSGTSVEAVSVPQNAMLGGERRRSSFMASDTSAELEKLNFAVAAMHETNENMQTQLRMQSKQLRKQSRQLQLQSQQMEGLQNQLQKATSLLTKFGVMMSNPHINSAPKRVSYRGVNFDNLQVLGASSDFSDDESESSQWDSE